MSEEKMLCPWCGSSYINPVGEPKWHDNKGEGGSGIGKWLQVFTHEGCDSGPPNYFTKWTYEVKGQDKKNGKNK